MRIRESLLGISWIYKNFQITIKKREADPWFAREIIRAQPDTRILDIGCGPANILSHLSNVAYLGIDNNQKYIVSAKKRFGERGEFQLMDIADLNLLSSKKFDIVLILGVLHHLNDLEVLAMLEHAAAALKPSGRIVTADPAFDDAQNLIARALVKLDRGRHVRSASQYRALLAQRFKPLDVIVRHDLCRLPYTSAIISAVPYVT